MNFYSGVNIRNLLKLVLLMVFIFSFNSLAQSNNKWYISPLGSGNQSGTSRSNAKIFTSINDLSIQPGDTIFVVEGNYIGQLYFRKNGTANALITIMPDPQNVGEAVFTNPNGFAIDIQGQDYIRLKQITIRNANGGVTIGRGKVKFLDSLHISKIAGTGISIYGNNGGGYNPAYNPGIDSDVDSVFIRWCYVATDTQVNTQTDCITGYWTHGVRILNNYLLQGNFTGNGHNDCIQFGHGVGNLYIASNIFINMKENDSQIFMNGNSWGGYKTVIYNNVSIHYGAGTGFWQYLAYNGYDPDFASDKGDGEVYLIHNTAIGRGYPFKITTAQASYDTTLYYDSLYAVNNIFYVMNNDYRPIVVPRQNTDQFNALYLNNNIYTAINASSSRQVIESYYGNVPQGRWDLLSWQTTTPFDNSSYWQQPSFRNFLYNSSLYNQEDVRLAKGSVGIDAGRTNIKIKGNQWINLKTLIESFGLEWKSFDNPYVSWADGIVRDENFPDIGAVEYTDNQVISDNDPPVVVSAEIIDSINVNVTFTEPMDQSSVTNPINYSIDNGIIVNSVQSLSAQTVRLNTSVHLPGFYTVTVNNVTDTAGNVISAQQNSFLYGYNPNPLLELKLVPNNSLASAVSDTPYVPQKTFDGLTYSSGDPTSRWAAAELPQWIVYDLGDAKMLNKTRIQYYNWNQGRIYNYSIQVSTDSVNWTYVKQNVSSTNTEWTEEVFEPTPARYVKIIVHSNNQNNWASLWEAEFYGNLIISGNDDLTNVPKEFKLEQNYPNPFNPTTKIRYSIPRSTEYYSVQQKVTLKVYDILGNEIATLVDDYKSAGNYEVDFNASDIASGVYIYRLFVQDLQAKNEKNSVYTESKKMLLMR